MGGEKKLKRWPWTWKKNDDQTISGKSFGLSALGTANILWRADGSSIVSSGAYTFGPLLVHQSFAYRFRLVRSAPLKFPWSYYGEVKYKEWFSSGSPLSLHSLMNFHHWSSMTSSLLRRFLFLFKRDLFFPPMKVLANWKHFSTLYMGKESRLWLPFISSNMLDTWILS